MNEIKTLKLWEENVRLLHDNYEQYRFHPKLFMTPIFKLKYSVSYQRKPMFDLKLTRTSITLGAVFTCWESNPDLFRIKQGDRSGFILWISGSPFSGNNIYKCYDPTTKTVWDGKNAPNFLSIVNHLNACQSTLNDMLHRAMEEHGITDFTPFSLSEVINKVKEM